MSTFKRIKRLFNTYFEEGKEKVEEYIPLHKKRERYYKLEDAQVMLNDLGMYISPASLDYLLNNNMVLDDFIERIYRVEDMSKKKDIVTDFMTINEDYKPIAFEEDGRVGFSINYNGEDVLFAEYRV